ncbi:spinster family MFS transporter [Oceanicaulis sp.]|uniref:spinster family MFS transporter n=1 Tax=Oceanicaulis sp. TaxID=1924941 RepID=UPI003D2A4D30
MANIAGGAAVDGNAGEAGRNYGTPRYRFYVLNALLVVYILNFVDRGLLAVAAAPIKAELGIDDTGFGLLTGFGFAMLYTLAGIPIARLAERKNRVIIIAVSVAFWSLMTAMCGLAMDVTIFGFVIGGFWLLLLFRIGVGLGEAGCTPPANSLLADYYAPQNRSSALGYYAMGVTLGSMLASLIGGPVTDAFGWRAAFFILGLPGIAIGAVLWLTIKEPPRGYTDPPNAPRPEKADFGAAMKELLAKPSYWTMTAGATVAAFCGYGISSFLTLYVVRSFELTTGQAAVYFNAPAALASAIGTFALGWLATRLQKKNAAAIAWLAAGGLALSVPFYLVAFTTEIAWLCVLALSLGGFIKYGYLAAQYTIGQGVVSTRVRATATAILLFVVNLLGYGLGPLFAGVVSDFWFVRMRATADLGFAVDRAACDAAQTAANAARLAGEAATGAPDALYDFCVQANAASTEYSMVTIALIYVVAAGFFVLCARKLKQDLVA